ncbi:MAG: hypothetical protein AAGI07_04210 [Bacteroidota bacterium]
MQIEQHTTFPRFHMTVEIAEDRTYCGQLIECPAIISVGDTLEELQGNIKIGFAEYSDVVEQWVRKGKLKQTIESLTFA